MAAAKKVVAKTTEEEIINQPEVETTDDLDLDTDEGDMSPADLQEAQSEAKAKIEAKLQEKRAKEKEADKEFYSKDETMELIEQAIKRYAMTNKKSDDDDDNIIDPSLPRKREVVVPRIENKFILGFQNLNQDKYRPDVVISSVELSRLDKTTGKNITEPWVKVILQGQEDTDVVDYPLNYLLKNSSKVACELVERKTVDASYDFGLIQQVEVEEYHQKMTDSFIKAKVSMVKETFVVRDPITGDTFEVSPDVVNWAQVKVVN